MWSNTKKTTKQAQDEIWARFPNIMIIGEYTGARERINLKCTTCGHEWKTSLGGVINTKHGCPKCGVREAKLKVSLEEFKEKLKSTDFEFIEYVGRKNNINIVSVKCKKCGYIRTTNMNNILRFGCNKCAQQHMPQCQSKSTEEFIKEAKAIHGDRYDYSKTEYIHNKIKVCVICPEHGEFWISPTKHLFRQQGCPICTGSGLEKIANTVLIENNVSFEKQKYINYKNHKMFIDFVINQNGQDYFIELNGEQHYKEVPHWERSLSSQQERDSLLQEYCDLNNIPLYWIRFDEIVKDKIENIMHEITAVFTSDCEDNNSAKTVETEMLIPC